jgi:hypothetical protein
MDHAASREVSAYGGLPEAVLRASEERASPLGASCHALTERTTTLLARAQKARRVRPEIGADDILVIVSALAWTQAGRACEKAETDRRLAIFWRGLSA